MADELEFAPPGAEITVISQSVTIADGEVVGGDTEFIHAEDYPEGEFTLHIPDGFGVTPVGTIDLLRVRGNVRGGTENDTALGYVQLDTTDNKTDPEDAELVGQFPASVTGAYRKTITIELAPSDARYYIQANVGTTLVRSAADITVKMVPISYKPGA